MVRRYDPHAPRRPERWDEDDDEAQRQARDLFENESQFARGSGDPRWGTGGMPVADRRYRASYGPAPHEWPPRRYHEPDERAPAYAPEWEPTPRGPYAGRGPRGYRRSDERILEDVCERFTENGQLDPSDVEVAVRGGEVVLSGTVATRAEKRLAEDIADVVFGVVEVHNRLRVHRPGEPTRAPSGVPPAVG